MARELFEETGIRAEPEEFEHLCSGKDKSVFFDFYCLKRSVPLEQVVLQPGETDGAKWVTLEEIHDMIRRGDICPVIATQFLRQEKYLLERQNMP